MILRVDPKTMIQKHAVTGARFTRTCYRIGDLVFKCSEGTEDTFRLQLPTSKWFKSGTVYVGCRWLSTILRTVEMFKVLIHVCSCFMYVYMFETEFRLMIFFLYIGDFGAFVILLWFWRVWLMLIHSLTVRNARNSISFDDVRWNSVYISIASDHLWDVLDVLGFYSCWFNFYMRFHVWK